MRSIPIAMTWELLWRGRWNLLLGLLGANLLPLVLLTALRFDGALDPTEPGFITMQVVLAQIQIFTFGAALLAFHEITPRHYTMPVTTSTLVVWRLLPAMFLMALEQVFSTVLLNTVFGLNWPVWGPALLAPVSLAMVLAGLWYAPHSSAQPFYVIVAGTVIGLWYKSRCGPLFSVPTQMWSTVTPADVITLCGFGLAAYFVSIVGVNRNRCGDESGSIGMAKLLMLDVTSLMSPWTAPREFRTASEAQFWCEWTKKGLVQPMVVALAVSVGLPMWLLFSRDPLALLEGLIAGGAILCASGMVGGLVIGTCGATDTDLEMGQFLATRPLDDRDLATTLLKVSFRSVVISWAIWITTFGVIAAIMLMTAPDVVPRAMQKVQWWFFPASLVGCWVVVAVSACLALTGRGTLFAKLFGGGLPVCIIVLLLTKLLDREMQAWLFSALLFVSGITIAGLGAWTMIAARRRTLIDTRVVVLSALGWIGLIGIVIFESQRHPGNYLPLIVFIAGLAAWVVAPFSATTLAVCSNRHR